MDRRPLAVGALCLLLVSAGCAGLGPGGGDVDRERLATNATYDWDTDADVTIDVGGGYYHAVYRVEDRDRLAFSRFHRLNDRRPLDVEAVAFRYPNGTVVGAESMAFERNGTHLAVDLPARSGRFAYRVPMSGKQLHVATATGGAYEVVLPPRTRVRYPLIGRVVPDGYERTIRDGRVHLAWDDLRGDRLVVRFYLVRDLWIFTAMVLVGVLAGAVGLAYFWLQLRGLRSRREAVDLER